MAQRGGAVQSTVMVDCGYSPAIPLGGADFVVGLEPVETARALPYIGEHTVVYMNTVPIVPFVLAQQHVLETGPGTYPDVEELCTAVRSVTSALVTLDATELASRAGSIKTANVVMLGCLFGSASFPFDPDDFVETVIQSAPPKLVQVNTRAFRAGVALSREARAGARSGSAGDAERGSPRVEEAS
jgi:indolepyruvate ferredoxin oxidoreductase beta subunit